MRNGCRVQGSQPKHRTPQLRITHHAGGLLMGRNIFPHTNTGYYDKDGNPTGEDRPPTLDPELHPGWGWAKPEHIPAVTYWPAALALGITLLFWGLITSFLLAIIGLIVFGI